MVVWKNRKDTKQMKTALQHFNELPQPYGQMAIEETIRQGFEHKLNEPCSKASKALILLFKWRESKSGHNVWSEIYNNLQHLESQSKQDKGWK